MKWYERPLLLAALGTLLTAVSAMAQNAPPKGKVTINAGKPVTQTPRVLLKLTATDDGGGAIQMCISNTAKCGNWRAFSPKIKNWMLTGGSGIKTVNVWFRDAQGMTTPKRKPFKGTILLDTQAPADGTVTATPGDTQLTLNWSDFADNIPGSGIGSYKAVFQIGNSAPSSCTTGTLVPNYVSPAATLVHTGLVNGTTYAYRVCAIDAVGNISAGATVTGQPVSTPPPDTTPPADGTVTATPGDTQLTLTWSGFTDTPGTGIVGYQAFFQEGGAPASCSGTAVPGYAGTAAMLAHGGLTNGTVYGYRVCAIDAAGNISAGATVTGQPVSPPPPDTTPPTGTVTINGGAAATNSTAATLTLAAVDAGGGAIEMCIGNTALPCTTWVPLETTVNWTLATGSGIATVYVWYRDQWDNTSATPNSDTIIVDTTAPADGTLTVTPADTQLTLNWSGFTDAEGSGITGYQAVFQEGSAPASCALGTPVPVYAGTVTTLAHTDLLNGTTYGYRICAIDAVGHVSSGATATGQPVVQAACEGCHNGNPEHPLAPNVMISWDGSWWDSTQLGDDETQQGGHGDPDGMAAVACTGCHDVNLPTGGYHLNGILESTGPSTVDGEKFPLNVNENTAHLKAAFIASSGGDNVQVTFNSMCSQSTPGSCHNTNSVSYMGHARDTNSTLGQVTFGEHLTDMDGNDLPTHLPIDSDLTVNKSTANPDYAPCISCHDPHGTRCTDTAGRAKSVNSNKMLRYDWGAESSKLCRICH